MRLGLEHADGRPHGTLVRMTTPRTLRQAAVMLAEETGLAVAACETSLTQFLLLAYDTRSPDTGRSLLAFRLHQFIAGAGDLYGTLEPPGAVSHAERPAVQAGRPGQDAVHAVFLPRLWPGVSPRGPPWPPGCPCAWRPAS